MSQELIYTSVPRGLRPGAIGFCTVAMTAGMPSALAERLELLGGYRPVFPLGDPRAGDNPVIHAHWLVVVGGQPRNVLSRVAFAGADYSSRSNKFAHHVVVEPRERAAAGPAWLLGRPGLMKANWSREPQLLPAGPALPSGDRPPAPCTAWAAAAGDAGWAGVLADAFRSDPSKPAYLIFQPGADMLPLIEEAIALLPPAMRWRVTFSTYFTELPMETTCAWRCVVAGTAAAKDAVRAGHRALVIDLTKPPGAPPETPMVEAARTGRASAAAQAATTSPGRAADGGGERTGVHSGAAYTEPGGDVPRPDRSRRRLVPAQAVEYQVEDPEEDGLHQVAIATATVPPNAYGTPIRRGVPAWATVVTALVCLAGGVGLGYGLAATGRMPASPEITRLTTAPVQADGPASRTAGTEKHEPTSTAVTKPRSKPSEETTARGEVPGPRSTNPEETPSHPEAAPPASKPGHPPKPVSPPTQIAGGIPKAPPTPSESFPFAALSSIYLPTDHKYSEGSPQSMILPDGVYADAIGFLFPNNRYDYTFKDEDGEKVITQNSIGGQVKLSLRIKGSSAVKSPGASDGHEIITFDMREGKIRVWWKLPFLESKPPKLGTEVHQLLSFSALLACREGRPTAVLTLHALPLNVDLPRLEAGQKCQLPKLAPGLETALVVDFPKDLPDGNWKSTESTDNHARYEKNVNGIAYAFDLILSNEGVIQSTWDETERLNMYKQWKHRLDHEDQDEVIKNLNERLRKASEANRKGLQDQKTARDKEINDNVNLWRSQLDAYEQLGEFRIQVKLRNGNLLGTMIVGKPQPGQRES